MSHSDRIPVIDFSLVSLEVCGSWQDQVIMLLSATLPSAVDHSIDMGRKLIAFFALSISIG